MSPRVWFAAVVLAAAAPPAAADLPPARWPDAVETALARAGDNRPELEKALAGAPADQRKGMAFLVEHMPAADLRSLTADYLLTNVRLAYQARAAVPWGKDIPDDVFLNDVLPYANVDEMRDPWRQQFYDLCLPLVKDCKTPAEAAHKLNTELFKVLKVGYSTQRRAPNQGPKESIASGKASCTGLSIVLADACRAVCVPARVVGTPLWADKRGNHTWVEVWDKGWHFTGACEADPQGLDRGWFVGAAAQAKKDVPEHAIYAASFKRTGQHFPLVWARGNRDVPAENVTDRYAKPPAEATTFRLQVKVVDAAGKRVARPVTVAAAGGQKFDGTSRDETADANHFLAFDLPPDAEYVVTVGDTSTAVKAGAAGGQKLVEIKLK